MLVDSSPMGPPKPPASRAPGDTSTSSSSSSAPRPVKRWFKAPMTITNARGRRIVLSGWSSSASTPVPAPSCALPTAPDALAIASSLESLLPGYINASRSSLAAAASLTMPHLISLAADSAQFIGPAGPFGSSSSSSAAAGASAAADGDVEGEDGGAAPSAAPTGPVNFMNISNETAQSLMLQADDGLRCLLCASNARGKAYKYIGKARRHLEIAHFFSEESAAQSIAAAAAIGVVVPPNGSSDATAASAAGASADAAGSGGAKEAGAAAEGKAAAGAGTGGTKRPRPAHAPGISSRGAAVLAADPDRKRFLCPFPTCAKEYLSRQSLAAHRRLKHAGQVPPTAAGAEDDDAAGEE